MFSVQKVQSFIPCHPNWSEMGCFSRKFDNDEVRIDGKIVIVTGSNTGIGKETVQELARRGARVYMACRDFKRCEEARLEIVKATGNQNVFNMKLDLSSQESIREFVRL